LINKKTDSEKIEYLTKQMELLFEQNVSAVFIESDLLIIRAYRELFNKGYKFNENFCITGFDNVSVPEWFNIPYIYVEQNFYEIGKKAAEMMVNMIEKKEISCKKVEIPVRIVQSQDGRVKI
jgi:DNA-binding LacI/PurR family transcriptional regulator